MKIIQVSFLLALLLLSGCKSIDTHPSLESLSQQEINSVFVKFKVHLVRMGMKQVIRAKNTNPNYATFEFNNKDIPGISSNEYIDLSYTPENGFMLKITKAIKKSLDFSDKHITDLKLNIEQMISESTSKNVQLLIFTEYPFE